MPVPVVIAQIPLLRQHVAHCVRLQRRQVLLIEAGFEAVGYLSFGLSSQYPFRFLDDEWSIGSCGGRVEADGSTQLGIPKLRILNSSGPRALHHAHETVLALDRALVTMPSEHQALGIV